MINQEKCQELFNKALFGIREQAGFAVTKFGQCRYRTEDGKKCAAGHNIPNELYHPCMENRPAGSLGREWDIFTDLSSHDVEFLTNLQRLHDSWGRASIGRETDCWPDIPAMSSKTAMMHWEHAMGQLAKKNKLNYTPLTTEPSTDGTPTH